MDTVIYKVLSQSEWKETQEAGVFRGSPLDLADGFIHLSSSTQAIATVQKYFAGRDDLVLLSVDASKFEDALRWEASRDGALFPHIYADLPMSAILKATELTLRENGTHEFPDDLRRE